MAKEQPDIYARGTIESMPINELMKLGVAWDVPVVGSLPATIRTAILDKQVDTGIPFQGRDSWIKGRPEVEVPVARWDREQLVDMTTPGLIELAKQWGIAVDNAQAISDSKKDMHFVLVEAIITKQLSADGFATKDDTIVSEPEVRENAATMVSNAVLTMKSVEGAKYVSLADLRDFVNRAEQQGFTDNARFEATEDNGIFGTGALRKKVYTLTEFFGTDRGLS